MNLIFSLTRPWLLIMVILLHYRVFNDDLLINFWGGDLVDTHQFICQLCKIAVPLYFLMSGYFLYNKKKLTSSTYKQILIKRVKSLIVPYLLWNLASLILNILGGNILFHSKDIGDILILFIKQTPSLGPINHPLWYLRDLFIFVLISPICYIIGKSVFKHVLFLVLILLWLIGLGDTITYDGFGGLLFFYSGILLNINDIDIYRKIKVLANRIHLYIAAYMICSILLVLYRDDLSGIYLKLCTLVGIWLFVSLLERHKNRLIKSHSWNLSQNSFFLYCMHGIFTGSVSGILTKIAIIVQHPLIFILLQVIIISGAIVVLCLFSKLVKNITPTAYSILSGGR